MKTDNPFPKSARPADNDQDKPSGSHTIGVRIRAKDAIRHKDGEWLIVLPAVELNNGQRDTLNELFPHCQGDVEKALAKEALINALIPTQFF